MGFAPIAILLVGLATAALVSIQVGATKASDGSSFFESTWVSMTEQPGENVDKAFNWLLFSILAAGTIVASAAMFAAHVVATQLHLQRLDAWRQRNLSARTRSEGV